MRPLADAELLQLAGEEARAALGLLYEQLGAEGLATPGRPQGQLIRPVLSFAGARALGVPVKDELRMAAGAVQLAHEASLLHDDVIDGAPVRRSQPTLHAVHGVAAALIEGDHLLTTAYRLAARTRSADFVDGFATAVERTVAGEKLQGRSRGEVPDEATYRRVMEGKAGELIGCALAAGALTNGNPEAGAMHALGRELGVLYQMLDDLLDYCPDADTGKPALSDFRQRRWTWPLRYVAADFGEDAEGVARCLASRGASGPVTPLRMCLEHLRVRSDELRARVRSRIGPVDVIDALLRVWLLRARDAVLAAERSQVRRRVRDAVLARTPRADATRSFFRANSKSFSFAARLFPADFAARVERVYAFCRVTDDLADDAAPTEEKLEWLAEWERLARGCYTTAAPSTMESATAASALVASVMADARASHVPFSYVAELLAGMRMDLAGVRYETRAELDRYTYRVAGVVGQWLTRLAGVHDDVVLEHAAELGHAMQLTNIIRDVGEDLQRGRLYLPAELLRAVELDERALRAMAAGADIAPAYRELIGELMAEADVRYARALQALPALPPGMRRAVAVAAHVYRGIHDEVRANGFDNLTRRAATTGRAKGRLALRALLRPSISPPQTGALLRGGRAVSALPWPERRVASASGAGMA